MPKLSTLATTTSIYAHHPSSESIVMFFAMSNPTDEPRFNSDDGDGNREGDVD